MSETTGRKIVKCPFCGYESDDQEFVEGALVMCWKCHEHFIVHDPDAEKDAEEKHAPGIVVPADEPARRRRDFRRLSSIVVLAMAILASVALALTGHFALAALWCTANVCLIGPHISSGGDEK